MGSAAEARAWYSPYDERSLIFAAYSEGKIVGTLRLVGGPPDECPTVKECETSLFARQWLAALDETSVRDAGPIAVDPLRIDLPVIESLYGAVTRYARSEGVQVLLAVVDPHVLPLYRRHGILFERIGPPTDMPGFGPGVPVAIRSVEDMIDAVWHANPLLFVRFGLS
jgi:hypothetical protein